MLTLLFELLPDIALDTLELELTVELVPDVFEEAAAEPLTEDELPVPDDILLSV